MLVDVICLLHNDKYSILGSVKNQNTVIDSEKK